MEQKILKYKKLYRVFITLALIGFVDSIIIPMILNTNSRLLNPSLLSSISFHVFGNMGTLIVSWFINLWFIWAIIAFIFDGYARKLENINKLRIIKHIWIFILSLIVAFFVNFYTFIIHIQECGLERWPCFSESFDSPVVTKYLNFLTHPSCGGFSGGICSSGGFSLSVLIYDIIFALIMFFIVLKIISIFHKNTIK